MAMRAYALDLRERVLRARDRGLGAGEVARVFGLSRRSVERYWKRYRETGGTAAGKMGGHRVSKLAPHDATLREWIGRKPDLTLAELRQRCREELGISLGTTALWHRLERLGLSYKKNAARRRADPARP
jgi:transposase